MKAISCPAALLLITLCPALARSSESQSAEQREASNQVELRYRFAMGEVLRYRVNHASSVRTTIDNSTQQIQSDSKSIKAWKVTDVLPNGEMEFIHLVESVKMSNSIPGGAENKFDSESDAPVPPGFAAAAQAVGVPLSKIRISPSGEVVHRERKHPQPPVSDDMPITLVLPERPVSVGDKWDAVYDVSAKRKNETTISVRTRRLCRLKSVKSGVAVIDVEYQILSPVDSYVQSQLVERLTKGSVRFDVERGRIVAQQHKVDRRILGFAGRASSLHFLARLQERLITDDAQLTTVSSIRR